MELYEQVKILRELGFEMSDEWVEQVRANDACTQMEEYKLVNQLPFHSILMDLGMGERDFYSDEFKPTSKMIFTTGDASINGAQGTFNAILKGIEAIMEDEIVIDNISATEDYDEDEDIAIIDLSFEANGKTHEIKLENLYEGWLDKDMLLKLRDLIMQEGYKKQLYVIDIDISCGFLYQDEENMKHLSEVLVVNYE